MDKSSLGDRMKKYEKVTDCVMPQRLPVIVRCDGKKFSKFTKKVNAARPFDDDFSTAMRNAMLYTASKIEGCLYGFTQSDEITFVLRNDQSLESVPWFDNRIQKICSVVSSMVTASFNRELSKISKWSDVETMAYFDTRVFVVPNVVEAQNVLVWRQNDAVKNSISCACYYEVAKTIGKKSARKLMHGLNQNQQQELLFKSTGINWNNYPVKFKRGVGCRRITRELEINGNACTRSSWELDLDIPIFAQDKTYLTQILYFE